MTIQEFQSQLAKLMEQYGLTVKDVAHVAGCSFPTVERWLRGVSSPASSTLRAAILADVKELVVDKGLDTNTRTA